MLWPGAFNFILESSVKACLIAMQNSDILVIKIILVLILVSFHSNHFYFI